MGIAAGLLVAVAVAAWTIAAPDTTVVNRTAGEETTLLLEHGERVNRSLNWSTTVRLGSETDRQQVEIAVPYTVHPQASQAIGARVELQVTVDGVSAYRHLLYQGPGVVSQTLPLSQFDRSLLGSGAHRIDAHLQVQRSADAEGSAEVQAGPLVVRHPTGDQPGLPGGATSAMAGLAGATVSLGTAVVARAIDSGGPG